MLGFIKFWSKAQIVCLLYVLKSSVTGEGRTFDITNYLTSLFEANYSVTKKSKPVNSQQTMFIMNHRSWSDFCIDSALLGGPSFLSRFAVILGVPFPVLVSWFLTSIWLFERKGGISREWFTEFFRKNLALRPGSSVIVYPEGTRNIKKEPLSLKTGVFECAWNLKLPVQAVITTNKEVCLSERTLLFTAGVNLRTSVSKVIYPKDFASKEEFFDGCKKLFLETWDDAYNDESEVTKIPELPLPGVITPIPMQKILTSRLRLVRTAILLVAIAITLMIRKLLN